MFGHPNINKEPTSNNQERGGTHPPDLGEEVGVGLLPYNLLSQRRVVHGLGTAPLCGRDPSPRVDFKEGYRSGFSWLRKKLELKLHAKESQADHDLKKNYANQET